MSLQTNGTNTLVVACHVNEANKMGTSNAQAILAKKMFGFVQSSATPTNLVQIGNLGDATFLSVLYTRIFHF